MSNTISITLGIKDKNITCEYKVEESIKGKILYFTLEN